MMRLIQACMVVPLISTAMLIYLRGSHALYNCNNRLSCSSPTHHWYSKPSNAARNNFVFTCSTSHNLKKRAGRLVRNNLRLSTLTPPFRSGSSDTTCNVDNDCSWVLHGKRKTKANMEKDIVPDGMLMERNGPSSPRLFFWDERRGTFSSADKGMGTYWWLNPVALASYLVPFIRHIFIPEDVSPDYISFTRWRCTQRFLSSTVNVFGTKALLIALGVNSKHLGAIATTSWVLKDALGKLGRILWAGKMGQRFDADAKRWRFRSSLFYGIGSGLEIGTYVLPSLFFLFASCGNILKQASMVTSSATRNTIYRSFALRENIGDITAKGEAQIAVVDMLGILSGILLCNAVDSSRFSIGCMYVSLSVLDIFAIYHEIRSVVFTLLNYERASIVIDDFVTACGKLPCSKSSPLKVSMREHVFLPSRNIPNIFRTVTGACLSSPQLLTLSAIFADERFLVAKTFEKGYSIILHTTAEPIDAIKALLCLRYMRDQCDSESDWDVVLKAAQISIDLTNDTFQSFLEEIDERGWSRKKFMFGDMKRRSNWSQVVTSTSSHSLPTT